MLYCISNDITACWSDYLPWVEYAHNAHHNDMTGMAPFLCSLGYQPLLFSAQEVEIAVPSLLKVALGSSPPGM